MKLNNLVMIVGLALSGCAVRAVPEPEYVSAAPPVEQVEVVGVAPSPNHFWIAGHWYWAGGRYAWRPGYWEVHRRGYEWVGGHWDHPARGHYWVEGRWVRR